MKKSWNKTFKVNEKSNSGVDLIQRRLLANEILCTLSENKFVRCERLETSFGDNSELVFVSPIKTNKRYMVAVYTSCNQVGGAYVSKRKGKDAIRIAGLFVKKDGTTCGIIKNKRVNRTGLSSDVCKRMMQRVAKTRLQINERILDITKNCKHCGSPTFISKKGNEVCSELCWRK